VTTPDPLLTDSRYLPYLPLVYVAWSNGELSPAELNAIRDLAARRFAPGIDDQPVLARWLDPDSPPSATEMMRLLRRIRELSGRSPRRERQTLAGLGEALARGAGTAPLPEVVLAINELEDALGVASAETVRELLGDSAPELAAPPPAATFDVGTMTRLLDGRYHADRNRIRDLLSGGDFVHVGEISTAEYREQVYRWLTRLAEEGIGRLAYPEVTGAAEDLGSFMACVEALSDFDISLVIKMGVQFGLFGGAVYFLGTEKHRAILPDVASLTIGGCFAMTETGHGSNVQSLATTGTYDPAADEWVIHSPDADARKDYIGNAACHANLAAVFAQLVVDGESHGVHAWLVPIRDAGGAAMPGVTISDCGHKMGLNGVDNGRLSFNQVRIPRENLLDRYGSVDADGAYSSPIPSPTRRFFTMLGTLVAGRITIATSAVAAARSALTIAIRYGARRRQFGPSGSGEVAILDYQTHQRRLMPALAHAYALTFTLRDVVDSYLNRDESTAREVEALAAAIKASASWFATAAIQDCRECCGGAGYLAENRFAALKADTDIFTTFEGDNTVLMQLAAKGLLGRFQAELGEARIAGIVRHLVARAGAELSELDPLTPRLTSREHLRDPEFHAEAFQHREDKLLWGAAGRLRSRIQGGMDSFQAMIECQDHLVSLGKAHADRVTYERFAAAVARVSDPDTLAALTLMRDLYALSRLEAEQAWFLRHGVFEAGKARAIRDAVNDLCLEARGSALALVDAFAIPESALGAPIAF